METEFSREGCKKGWEESEAGNIFLDLSRSEDERTESGDEKDDGGCRKSYFHLKTFLENFSASSTCFFTHFLSLLPLSLSLSVLFSILAFSSLPSFLPPPPPLNLCQRKGGRERDFCNLDSDHQFHSL